MSSFSTPTIFSLAFKLLPLALTGLDRTSIFFSYIEGSPGRLSLTYAIGKAYPLVLGVEYTRIAYAER